MSTVYVVGLGPGAEEQMTVRAQKVLEHCPVLIGHTDAERTGAVQNGI